MINLDNCKLIKMNAPLQSARIKFPLSTNNEVFKGLKQSCAKKDRIEVELTMSLEEIKHLNKIIEKLQIELDGRTREISLIRKNLKLNPKENSNIKYEESLQEYSNNKLIEENRDLNNQLKHLKQELENSKIEYEQIKKELASCKAFYNELKKSFEDKQHHERKRQKSTAPSKIRLEVSKQSDDDFKELIMEKNKVEFDLNNWITTAENHVILINVLKEKIKQISKEKYDYELLLTQYRL